MDLVPYRCAKTRDDDATASDGDSDECRNLRGASAVVNPCQDMD